MQFRMYPVVGGNYLRLETNQKFINGKGAMTLFRPAQEGPVHEERIENRIESRSPCPEQVSSFYWAVSGLDGATGRMTFYPFHVEIGYTPDCFEQELSEWVRETLAFLALDGKVEPIKVPISTRRKLRLE